MKKKHSILVLLFFNFTLLFSQEFSIGIKGGLNFNNIGELYHIGFANGGGIGVIPIDDVYYKAKNESSSHFGGLLTIDFKTVFIRSEINFTTLKNNYPLAKKTSYWTSSKIDIPILVGVKIYKPISFYVGPAFSKISTMELKGAEHPLYFKKSAINLNTGILVDFGRFGFDVRYEYGLKSFDDQRVDIIRAVYGTNVGYLLKYNPSQIIVSLHINLLKINKSERGIRAVKGWRNHKNL